MYFLGHPFPLLSFEFEYSEKKECCYCYYWMKIPLTGKVAAGLACCFALFE